MSHDAGRRNGRDDAGGGGDTGRAPGKSTLTGKLQRKAASGADAGSPAAHWATATSGTATEVPYRADMEQSFGQSFAHVEAYCGEDAVSGLTGLGAAAAAQGHQVAFRDTNPDRGLVAHELAHVVQQSRGPQGVQAKSVGQVGGSAEARADAAAAAVLAGQPVGDVGTADSDLIHLAVDTNGGRWDTTTYAPNSAPTGAVGEGLGCHIVLTFTANDLVESTKIGLIQSVKAFKSSTAGGPRGTVATGVGDPEENQLIMTGGQADPGREIDRAVHPGGRALPNTSPIYGVHNQPAAGGNPASVATSLTDGTPTTGTSQWGSHVRNPATRAFNPAVPAIIDDRPGRAIEFAGQTYEHTFESAAIALEGPIRPNTYLGSVSWGWRNDAAGHVTVDPIAVVSEGTPSDAWLGAAERWNAATFTETGTANTHASVDIPTAAGPERSLDEHALHERMRELSDQMLRMDRNSAAYAQAGFDARACASEAVRRGATAADSGHTLTVTRGDTLWGIATRHLGGGARWTQIFALNRTAILDPNRISVGQVLKMPVPFTPRADEAVAGP